METPAVIVNKISKTFKIEKPDGISKLFQNKPNHQLKTLTALDDVSFTVQKGEILGIIGLNGSGKTTLLRVIAGIYKPDTGSIQLNGSLSSLMQLGAGFQTDLDSRENIIVNGMLLGLTKSEIQQKVDSILKYAELEKFSNMKLKHYSSGMRARLAFATSMEIDPDILLLDEIHAVGDKNFRKKSLDTFLSLKNKNRAIIHTTHSLVGQSEFSDRLLLLHQGKMVMIGKPEEVIEKYNEVKPTN